METTTEESIPMRPASLARLGLLACLWGSNFLFIKVAVEGLSPILVVVARMLLGAAVLLSFVAMRRERLPARRLWVHLAVAALVANVIPYFLFSWGEQRVSSATAGVLNATTPLFTVLLVLITRTERMTLYRTSGLV